MDQGEFGTASSGADIVSVECEPVYAEHYVTISASELYSRCDKQLYWSEAAPFELSGSQPNFTVRLDNDGNGGAVLWGGPSCAAGESFVEAHLDEACHEGGLLWVGPEGKILGDGEELTGLGLDNDGNAFVVALGGESCAAGSSLVEASLENAPYTTYTTDFNILPPVPTFPPAG